MGWYGMVWDGDLTGWDWTGRDEMGWDVLCAPEPCRRSATPGRGLAQPGTCVPLPWQAAAPFHTRWDGMVWNGMVWYGDLTGWDWMGRDGMGWDGMGCVSRSRAAGAPRLGKGCHTQINVCIGLVRLRHPSTLDGMGWDGMGW